LDDDQILEAAKTILVGGIKQIKLYFIIGLPGEKEEDVGAIVELSKRIANLGYTHKNVRLSINPLIPKPHTPFQFKGYGPTDYLRKTIRRIKRDAARDPRLEIETLNIRRGEIQALLSLGDSRLAPVLSKVAAYGVNMGSWRRALKEEKITVEEYISPRKFMEKTPWSRIRPF